MSEFQFDNNIFYLYALSILLIPMFVSFKFQFHYSNEGIRAREETDGP